MSEEAKTFWKLINQEAEIIRLKSELSKFDSKLQSCRDDFALKEISLKKEIDLIRDLYSTETERLEKVKKELKAKNDRLLSMSDQLMLIREEMSKEKMKSERILDDYKIKSQEFKLIEQRISAQLQTCKREAQKQQTESKLLYDSKVEECEKMMTEKQLLQKRLESMQADARKMIELKRDCTDLAEKNTSLKSQVEKLNEYKTMNSIFSKELKDLNRLKQENKELLEKNAVYSKRLVNESVLRSKVSMLENECEELGATSNRIMQDKLRAETLLEEFRSYSACQSSSQLRELLDNLQSAKNDLESESKSKQELSEKINELEILCKRLQKRCLLLTKERDSYKTVIDSYEHEVTLADASSTLRERISCLEGHLTEYRKLVDSLEQQLIKKQDNADDSGVCLKRKRMSSLSESKDVINTSVLQNQPIQPADLSNYRIIHLVANPLDECRKQHVAEYKSLIEENKRLKARLQLVINKSRQSSSSNDTPSTSATQFISTFGQNLTDLSIKVDEEVSIRDENKRLRQELEFAEKKREKVLEKFRKMGREFREVVYILTGYRIDALKGKIYRLSHVYSEFENNFLLFELEEDSGSMKLLQNDYSARLEDHIETYLNKHDSFPAFLASLTLDLFRRQTHIMAK